MFNAYKRFFAFAGKQKKTWYKGMGYELLRSIFEAIQFIALLVVLRALVEQNVTGETALAALGVMLVSVTGAAVFWYLAHNSEGQANYHMCEEKRIRIGERMKYMPMGYFNSKAWEALRLQQLLQWKIWRVCRLPSLPERWWGSSVLLYFLLRFCFLIGV